MINRWRRAAAATGTGTAHRKHPEARAASGRHGPVRVPPSAASSQREDQGRADRTSRRVVVPIKYHRPIGAGYVTLVTWFVLSLQVDRPKLDTCRFRCWNSDIQKQMWAHCQFFLSRLPSRTLSTFFLNFSFVYRLCWLSHFFHWTRWLSGG